MQNRLHIKYVTKRKTIDEKRREGGKGGGGGRHNESVRFVLCLRGAPVRCRPTIKKELGDEKRLTFFGER